MWALQVSLGRILPQVGKLKTLANTALERPLGSVTTGGPLRVAAVRERWSGMCSSPPECPWGWLYCCWASPDDGLSACQGSDDVQMAKVFPIAFTLFCAVRLDVKKLIKPEIRSCNYYLIIRLQRWPHWYRLRFALDAEYIFFWRWGGLCGISIHIQIF